MISHRELGRWLTGIENGDAAALSALRELPPGEGVVVGITGPPGAGKSSLVDAMTSELRARGRTAAILAVDPTSRITGGAILGDRVRMLRHHADPGVFIRSMATRGELGGLARASGQLSRLFSAAGFDFVLVETVGVGQDEVEIAGLADVTLVVLVPGMGDDIQAIKAGIMEIADVFVINKADRPGAEQTASELATMLSFSITPGTSAPPIYKTIAVDGTGVSALIDNLILRQKKSQETQEPEFAIDHLGIAVRSIDASLAFYREAMGMRLSARETVAPERVNVAMLPVGETRIELLEPTDTESTIAKFLDKRGPGLHHVAMRVTDLPAALARLESSGVRVLGTPQRGSGGHLYCFVHPASTGGVLWELIQA